MAFLVMLSLGGVESTVKDQLAVRFPIRPPAFNSSDALCLPSANGRLAETDFLSACMVAPTSLPSTFKVTFWGLNDLLIVALTWTLPVLTQDPTDGVSPPIGDGSTNTNNQSGMTTARMQTAPTATWKPVGPWLALRLGLGAGRSPVRPLGSRADISRGADFLAPPPLSVSRLRPSSSLYDSLGRRLPLTAPPRLFEKVLFRAIQCPLPLLLAQ